MQKQIIIIGATIFYYIIFLNNQAFAQNKKQQIAMLTVINDSLKKKSVFVARINDSLKQEIYKRDLKIIQEQKKSEYSQRKISSLDSTVFLMNNELIGEKLKSKELTRQIIAIKNTQKKYNCSIAIGNSKSYYPIRITGESSGCMGDQCDEIPSDLDLHSVILKLDEDLNGDSIIDYSDLKNAIEKIGDKNKDQNSDIYDLLYPNPIKLTPSIENPDLILAKFSNDSNFIYLTGIVNSDDLFVLKLPSLIQVNIQSMMDDKVFSTKVFKEFDLSYYREKIPMILYRNKRVVLKGKLVPGNTQSYKHYVIFFVEEIVGKSIDKKY